MGSTLFQTLGTGIGSMMDSCTKFGAQAYLFQQRGGIFGHVHASGTPTDFNIKFNNQPNTFGQIRQTVGEICCPFSYFTNRAAEELAR